MVIVILTSNRIAGFLKSRFGNVIPGLKFSAVETTPTPTPRPTEIPTKGGITPGGSTKTYPTGQSTSNSQIPATGPEEFVYLLLAGSAGTGFILKKISSK